MLDRWREAKTSIYDEQIVKVLEAMTVYDTTDPEYKRAIKYLERLESLKAGNRREKVKPDTIFVVGGQVLSVLIIVMYEHNHAMISKGLSFINKPKI